MADVVIYTKFTCGYCQRAKQLLRERGVEFTEHDISMGGALREEMIQRANGRTTVPQIFINEEHIGGCDDLMALDRDDKLDALLKE